MNPSNRYVGFALVTVSGCLWFLACTPFDMSALAWIAGIPMLLAVDRAPTLKGALLLGWWAGVVETAGGFYWLIDLMQRFAGFPWLGAALVFLLFCATRASIFLIFTGVVRTLRCRARIPMAVAAPLVMVICEFIVPQLFPCGQWITQAWHPLVIQITELTGPLGITALLMLVNGALYDVVVRDRAARGSAVAAMVVLAAALLFGLVRMRQVDELIARAPRLKIGLVQPNFAYTVDGEFSREEALRELAALQEESARLERAGAQLLVWSEGSYPVALPRNFSADFPSESLAMIRRGFAAPVVIGANTLDSDRDFAFNSALLLDGTGAAVGRYDKVRLLAFGEYIPLADDFPSLYELFPPGTGKFKAGSGPAVMTLAAAGAQAWRLGPVICYEDLLPDFLRRVGKLHPDLLVNLTSDSWFGARTEPWEHFALSVFATIELRVALVRSVNSGISALVDPNGRVLDKTYADDPYREPRPADGVVVSAPKMAGGYTPFVAWGNWFPYTCMIGTCIIALVARRRPALGSPPPLHPPVRS
ncbi:MAG: apolipoprotein N-acyltransferase [Gammaproteobacteria bacterium]|nr:apolipoprotein N-acyltransferase [Gammaproteobacteria bacterium]